MREHEVPTHVQAEDKVLLWFTFPQIVAVVAVCALAYGAYRYFPFAPSEVRLGIAILLGSPGHCRRGGQGGRPGAAPGGRRPAEVQAGGQALRRVSRPARHQRAAPSARGEARPAASAGEEGGGQGGQRGEGGASARVAGPSGPTAGSARAAVPGTPTPTGPGPNGKSVKHRKPWSRFLAVSAVGALAVLALVLLPNIALADDPEDDPRTSPTATPGGWTKSTSSRRSRCRGAASSSRGWLSPPTTPTSPCGRPTNCTCGGGPTAADRAGPCAWGSTLP